MSHDILKTMERHLLSQDKHLLEELYEYGKLTGSLSRAVIMQMWSGVSLRQFSESEIIALFTFLNEKYALGDVNTFFPERAKRADHSLKEEYLSEITDALRRKNEESVLRRMSHAIEDVFRDEVFNLSAEELSAGLSNMGYLNRRTAVNELRIIRNYILWCRCKGYQTTSDEELNKVNTQTIGFKKSLFAALIPTPASLAMIIETTKADSDLKTDIVLLVLCWLGFTIHEIYDLLKEDVNLLDGTIRHEHYGIVCVPHELMRFLRDYANQDIIYFNNFTYVADK